MGSEENGCRDTRFDCIRAASEKGEGREDDYYVDIDGEGTDRLTVPHKKENFIACNMIH